MAIVWQMTKVNCNKCRVHICSVPSGWSKPYTTILYCPTCADKEEKKKK